MTCSEKIDRLSECLHEIVRLMTSDESRYSNKSLLLVEDIGLAQMRPVFGIKLTSTAARDLCVWRRSL